MEDVTPHIKRIIDKELATRESVSKYYVMEEIKNRVRPITLVNLAIAANVVTDDGIENMNRGAMHAYRIGMRRLKGYSVDRSGMIRRKVAEKKSEQFVSWCC